MIHTGFIIENLVDLFEFFNEKVKKHSKKQLDIRNLFAVAHVSNFTSVRNASDNVAKVYESLPENTTGRVLSYCMVQPFEDQGAFLGICLECLGKEYCMVLYDNGRNKLYRCRELMEFNKKKENFFKKLKNPIELKLRRYAQYEEVRPVRPVRPMTYEDEDDE
jgi:hypothetical protein